MRAIDSWIGRSMTPLPASLIHVLLIAVLLRYVVLTNVLLSLDRLTNSIPPL